MTDIEIIEEQRKRRLAILKASNELLKQTKEEALKHTGDPLKRAELEKQFDKALSENNIKAKNQLNASVEEVNNASYREADDYYVKKYEERLKKKGISDDELRRKETVTVTIGGNDGENKKIRRRRRGAKKDESEIVRLENEDEIMNMTMVKDDSDIEKNIKKNQQFEHTIVKRGNNKIEKMKDEIEDSLVSKKIKVKDETEKERITVANETVNGVNDAITVANEAVKQNTNNRPKVKKEKTIDYSFDFSNIPSYVQYDVIPLPSNGECYPIDSPLRCGRIPVAYLTASDENIMASPNVYRDGKLLDIILERKVLDKNIDVKKLCSGDRDAIILWLRATSYGTDFPITATNPESGKEYKVNVNLAQFKYKDFNLEGDDEGLFTYQTERGDIIKYKYLTEWDEELLRDEITAQITDSTKFNIVKSINDLSTYLTLFNATEEERTMLNEDIEEIKDIVGDLPNNEGEVYPNIVTAQMMLNVVSVNNNRDKEYIKNYVENMRTKDAAGLRNYISENMPGVNFKFDVNIPKSDGGGSFSTFLTISDTIFINI